MSGGLIQSYSLVKVCQKESFFFVIVCSFRNTYTFRLSIQRQHILLFRIRESFT